MFYFMSKLEETVKKAWTKTKENVQTRRYLSPSNYVSDVVAGNISRTPVYAAFDNVFVGVPDEKVLMSAANCLGVSACGWSLAYIFGNSMLATALGDTYQKHAKKIDAAYSAVMTFGFGMAVNLAGGYTMKQALAASAARAAMAIPLGPVTRYYTDAFRQMRGQKAIAKNTQFEGKGWKYSLPMVLAMNLLPIAVAGAILLATPNKNQHNNVPKENVPSIVMKNQ